METTGLKHRVAQLLEIDRAFAPRTGESRETVARFEFDANSVLDTLEGMELPAPDLFLPQATEVEIHIPGGVGDVILDPDGGVWIHAERISSKEAHAARLKSATIESLAVPA